MKKIEVMKQGDFTALAKSYINRPGYSVKMLEMIGNYAHKSTDQISVADVGAGTGKLTENLLELGYEVDAVEPNDAMREEGKHYTNGKAVTWHKGSGEDTGLATNSKDWLLMGSSFHWVDFEKGVKEFARVLRPGGMFTAIWNPRNLTNSILHMNIESKIHELAPEITRKSSGNSGITTTLARDLKSCGLFSEVIFSETEYELTLPKDRYLGAWESTNDIQAQTGPTKWKAILKMIEAEVSHLDVIPVPYKSRAWTAFTRK